jgi:hypothetical protein
MLYTSRGHFVEYDVLVAEMPRYLRCAYIDHGDLFAGRWLKALTRVMEAPVPPGPPAPPAPPATNGAEVAVQLITQRI